MFMAQGWLQLGYIFLFWRLVQDSAMMSSFTAKLNDFLGPDTPISLRFTFDFDCSITPVNYSRYTFSCR